MFFPVHDYNPVQRKPYITIAIIAVNILVFLYQSFIVSLPENAPANLEPLQYSIYKSALIPNEISHFKGADFRVPVQYVTDQGKVVRKDFYKIKRNSPFFSLYSSMFMHASFMHLFGNMLFLWIFGNNIEDYLGKVKFLVFYFLSAFGAALLHIIFNLDSLVPVVGASGAVSGIMGAYLILYPHAKVKTLLFIFIIVTFVDIPAYVFLGVWFVFQFFAEEGIAWIAHIGGFITGLLIIRFLWKKEKNIIEIIE